MAYYVFVLLTPPASLELAEYYINKALELNETLEYLGWSMENQSTPEEIITILTDLVKKELMCRKAGEGKRKE